MDVFNQSDQLLKLNNVDLQEQQLELVLKKKEKSSNNELNEKKLLTCLAAVD